MQGRRLGIRWTLGDVSGRGFEALRLSLWGAWRIFGPEAAYVVCVNSLPLAHVRAATGDAPPAVVWRDATDEVPPLVQERLGDGMAEGVAWKLAPLRLFPDRYEISLDNDCILWALPRSIAAWLDDDEPACLLAEDTQAMFGRFAPFCGPEPRNAGLRGLPPRFDLERALHDLLEEVVDPLDSELDEQGLQVAALSRPRPPRAVSLDEVTICSPFPLHRPDLGRCGAHFVGLNVRHFPWQWDGRHGEEYVADHWRRHRAALYELVGLRPDDVSDLTTAG